MQKKSLTADEAKHYRYGMNILNLNSDRLILPSGAVDDSKMPVTALNALPARLAEDLPEGGLRSLLMKFQAARFVTVLFSACIAWLVFVWARDLYGFIPGLASLFLYVFDPNLIAHSQLVTTDVYAAGMVTLSFYWLWRFAKSRRARDGLLCALVLGLSQLAKYTAVVLIPLGLVVFILRDGWMSWKSHDHAGKPAARVVRYALELFLFLAVAVGIALLVINIGYLFNRTLTPLTDYQFSSAGLQSLQMSLMRFGSLPVPAPYPYLQGLDLISYRGSTGFGYGRIYLLGQLHESRGFPGYFFIASLFKVPIATQVILWTALLVYFWRRPGARLWQDEIFLLLPVAFFAVYFNFFFNSQLGIRFYLVVFPLLYIFAGRLFAHWMDFSKSRKVASLLLAGYLSLSVFSYFPHYIPYFNEFVPDRRMAYKYLADSNIDWEQGQEYLKEYQEAHPEAMVSPRNKITSGLIVVDANDLVGVTADPKMYQWLRENFQPADTIAYSYLVYQISQDDLRHLCETTDYCK